MSLLEKLKKQKEQEKNVHPLKDESFEIRTNYLNAIAYLMVIDEEITEYEQEKFIKLIDALECGDLKEELLAFLKEPNVDEFDEIFEHLGVMKCGYYYLVEVLHLKETLEFNKAEEEFIELVLPKIGVDKSELELIEQFYRDKKDSKTLKAINEKENLQNSMHEMAVYLKTKDPYISFWAGSLSSASSIQKDDKEFILEVVKEDGKALAYASKRLKDDKEVVLEAVKQSGWALNYASERLKDDKEVVLEAVKQDKWALNYASERLKDDKEVVLEAVKQHGGALEHACERLKDDKEVVLEAVKQYGHALEYASERLKDDEELKELCNQINK